MNQKLDLDLLVVSLLDQTYKTFPETEYSMCALVNLH